MKTINNISIGYKWGTKDPWAVFAKTNTNSHLPLDKKYFEYAKRTANEYGTNKFMSDFMQVYGVASDRINYDFLEHGISKIAKEYNHKEIDEIYVDYLFTVLYLAMVSEFYYVSKRGNPSVANKNLKLVGMYQVIIEGMEPERAANWSKKIYAQEILEYARKIKDDLKNKKII